ncbi:hypothetical protein [Actinomadura litoris]|uniref:hypothetical protein n=1 Tax=Actinomadura litoris TaxID=2678616 RepID=UPI001FA6C8BA|nr:hypothetical protein [Actinomadura litoris]
MSAVIAWTCKLCGFHAEGLDVAEYMATERGHECKLADQIRRATRYFRARSAPETPMGAVADWLEACAKDLECAAIAVAKWGDAEQLTYSDYIDEPGAAEHALRIAQATPWEDT